MTYLMNMSIPVSDLPARAALANTPLGVFGTFKAARQNLLSIIPEIATRQPIVSGKVGIRWHMLMDPDGLRRVLLEKLDDYPKSNTTKSLMRPAIGHSMFLAEGAEWRWQRRAASPVFTHRNIANLAPLMSMAAERAVKRFEGAGKRAIDAYDEMITTTFEVISDVTFSGGSFDRDQVHHVIDQYINEAGRVSIMDILGFPDWVPRPERVAGRRKLKEMHALANSVIEERQKHGGEGVPDLLDLLLEGEDPETKQRMSLDQLRDNLMTFIVAGHETTALTLSWAIYLMARYPEHQKRARQEAQSVLQGRIAGADDVPNFPFTRQVIDETLRLYPAAAIISRTAMAPDTLCGREVRPKDSVIVPIYALHRSHVLWENPDAFDPSRFENPKSIQRYAYLPFGDGPRICIGASFALQEAIIILATLLSRFEFEMVAGKEPELEMIFTLRPKGGVWVTTKPA